jgi:4-hydroxy-tetrahydrodipicolinate synthase
MLASRNVNWTFSQDGPSLEHMTNLRGVHVPLITPFTADDAVATDALEALAHDVLAAGAAGIVALGTTAESATLTGDERRTVVDVCTRVTAEHGASLIVGVGSNDTRATAAALAGMTSPALVTVPYYTRPGEAGVLAHVEHLAKESPVPLVVYHIPHRTAQDLSPATLRAIGSLPAVVGFKYSTRGVDAATVDLLGDRPADCAILAGEDALLVPMLALGADGGILASAHLETARYVELVTGRRDDEGHRLARLSQALFAEPNPAVIKGVLHARGRIPTPDVRLPLLPASAEAVTRALAQLDHAGAR